jgi:hypothetical protein
MTPVKASADRESIFDRIADYVSAQQTHELASQIHDVLTASKS